MTTLGPPDTMHALSEAKRNDILALLATNTPYPEIRLRTGASTGYISGLRSKYCPDLPVNKGGRPTKISPQNLRHSLHLIRSGALENAVQVSQALNDITNHSVHPQTVRRHLKKAGMRPVVKKNKPKLEKRHKRERLDFALAHKHWTMDDWKRVIWSDETKINRVNSDGRKYVWKGNKEDLSDRLIEGTLKFGGGSLMMWGCMFWDGVGYACKIDGRMDNSLYLKIMQDELVDSIGYYSKQPGKLIFQQDNDPKHKAKPVQEWLEDQDFQIMLWPAQSPDLNPIEHLWEHLKTQLKKRGEIKGMEELWEKVQEEWEKITPDVCQNLILSMPKRIKALIRAKGGYIDY
jgi:hypothetical protein